MGYVRDNFTEEEERKLYDKAIESEGRSLRYENEDVRGDRDFWWSLLERDKRIYIEAATKELRDDEEFVIKALRDEADNIQYASLRLRNDKDVCMAVLYENNNLLTGFEGEQILDDYDFMIKLVKEYNWENVKFASEDLRNDEDFMRAALRQSSRAKAYIGSELLKDESFMSEVEKY